MVPLAIGTQTTGSTIRPASFCGVFGYRPTYGDLRCVGVKEAAGLLDTLGLLARSVEDIALYRDVLTGGDPQPIPEQARAAADRLLPHAFLVARRARHAKADRGRRAQARRAPGPR